MPPARLIAALDFFRSSDVQRSIGLAKKGVAQLNVPRLVLCVCLLLPGCSGVAIDSSTGANALLSPSQVNAEPGRFDGQKMTVKGFVLLSSNSHSLYESKELFLEYEERLRTDEHFVRSQREKYDGYCLTIANPGKLWEDPLRFRGKVVVFRGTFISNYITDNVIDLGACRTRGAILVNWEAEI